VDWRGRAGQVIDLIKAKEQRLADIVSQELEAAVVKQVPHIIAAAGKEVVEANDFVTLENQSLTQVRSNKARTSSHQHLHCIHRRARITPPDLHRVAAAGKYHAEDVRGGTYVSVIFLTRPATSVVSRRFSL
jgi:hypothetical protein